MSFIIVDVEADGPISAEFSMVCFGAVLFDETLGKSFYSQTRPISDRFVPEVLAVSGFSREQHLAFEEPKGVMEKFAGWLEEHSKGRPVFLSDNLAFDWQFINYYFHRFLGQNPFGFSGRRIGDILRGIGEGRLQSDRMEKVSGHATHPQSCRRCPRQCGGVEEVQGTGA
jgi:hypothetical protein